MAVILHKIPVGSLLTNCYILSCEVTGRSFIVDPGGETPAVVNYILRNEFIPDAVVLTHAHPDHTGGAKSLKGRFGIPLIMHSGDKEMLETFAAGAADKYVYGGDTLSLGREKVSVIHTPGHSPGSICLYTAGFLLSGDTLFKSGVGRTDLPGGQAEALRSSIEKKILCLPNNTAVYPGHGPETSIGAERDIVSEYF